MNSNKRKRGQLASRKWRKGGRERASEEEKRAEKIERLHRKAAAMRLLPIDRSKLQSCSMMGWFSVPTLENRYYLDYAFSCRDCGTSQVWTGTQQKRWYEEQGGEMEGLAIRCRECRAKKRAQKEEARRLYQERMERKRLEREKRLRRLLSPALDNFFPIGAIYQSQRSEAH